jgi:hypothetical protein
LGECFQNLLKPSEKNIEISIALADHLGDSIGPFIKQLNIEIVNTGLTPETFTIENLKMD